MTLDGLRRWPVSYAQELLWFMDLQWPGSALGPAYTVHFSEQLHEPIDVPALRRAADHVVRRHEVLRTALVVEDGRPWQVIVDRAEAPFTHTDLSALAEGPRERRFHELAARAERQPIEVTEAPLIRFDLVTLAPERHVLLVTAHHCAFDFWSSRLLGAELRQLYEALRAGRTSPLPELPIQYVDYADWQRKVVAGPATAAHLEYWARQLRDFPVTRLRTDRSRPETASQRGLFLRGALPAGVERRLAEIASEEGTTFFAVMLAVFAATVVEASAGWEAGAELVVPTWFMGRREPETEGLIGNFDDLLLLRLCVHPAESVRSLVRQARDVLLAAYEHPVPVVSLIEALPDMTAMLAAPENTWVVFHLHAAPGVPTSAGEAGPDGGERAAEVEGPEVRHAFAAALDVSVRVGEAGRLVVESVLDADLFEAATARRLTARYLELLGAVAAAPDAPLAELAAET